MSRLLVLPTLVVLSLLALAPSASAGSFRVFGCKTPAGAPAPTDGWAIEKTVGTADSANDCPVGGSLVSRLHAAYQQPPGARVGWGFTTTADLPINSVTLWTTGKTVAAPSDHDQGAIAYISHPSAAFDPDGRLWCWSVQNCLTYGTQTDAPTSGNSWWSGPVSLTQVHVAAGCAGARPCEARGTGTAAMAESRIQASEIHLTDANDPQVEDVRGALAGTGKHSGVEVLSFDADDVGAGVYRTFVEVAPGGSQTFATKQTTVVDDNDGRCAELDHYASSDYEFGYRVPCKPSVAVTLTRQGG